MINIKNKTTKFLSFVPGKPNLHSIYGPWNNEEEAKEALEWFNTTRDPEGDPTIEIPAGSTVAVYDDPETCTSVTEYWWKDGSLVLKNNNNSMIYAIVTDYDFIVYNDVDPTPSLLKVMRINYGLNNISHDMLFGKLGYKVDEGEWNYINHTINEDEFIKYDNTNKCFVFYLNNIRPLRQILFSWYSTNDDDSLKELLTTKSLLVTATSNDVEELYKTVDEIEALTLIDISDYLGTAKGRAIPVDFDTNPDPNVANHYKLYLNNNGFLLDGWTREKPIYSDSNKFNYLYKISRERKYGRWQMFTGPELIFIKGMDGSIEYEEVFYVTDQFGILNLITTLDFNLSYTPNYDSEDEFIISNGSKSETWSRTCKEVSATNLYRYARKRFLKSDGTYDVDWSYPYLHATYKPSDSYENIYKKSKKGLEEALGEEIRDINTYLGEHPDYKFSLLPIEEQRGWSYSAESLEEPGDIICLAYRGFSEDTVSLYQGPFIIGSYGENGLDGGNVEYIYRSSDQGTVQDFINSVIGDFKSWDDFADSLKDEPDEDGRPYQGGIDGEYIINGWSDDCPVRDAVKPYIYMIHRKYNGTTKSWGLYSLPKLWDKFIAYELIVSNKTPQIPSRYEGYSELAAKNATMTTIRLFAGGDEIDRNDYNLSWSTRDNVGYTTDGEGNYWLDDGIEKGSGCIVQKDHPYNITVTASYKGVNVSQTIYITRQDTDAYLLHVNPDVRIYLGDNDYSVDNYELYVTKLDVNGNYSKDNSGIYLLVLNDVGADNPATCIKYESQNPAGLQGIDEFINNPEYLSNDLMLYLYHWNDDFEGKTYDEIKDNLGERLDVTLINTINASIVVDKIDGNYQIALNYDTLNIPSSKIGNEDWFKDHKILAKVIHNGQINICKIFAHIDLIDSAEQIDNYIIDEQGNKVHEVLSDNGLLNILISQDINSDAILTIDAEIVYDRGSEYGKYTLTKNVPIHISTEAEVLNLFDNVGILYADNLGEYGILTVEFTVYDEIKELQYTGNDIEIIVSCSDIQGVTTYLIQDNETKKWILYLDTDSGAQASFMSAVQSYLSNAQNGNKVSINFSLIKNNIEKARLIIEIDFAAFKLPDIDVDMKNDSITLPIGWTSSVYNSVANIDCNINIDGKDISDWKYTDEHGETNAFTYRIRSNDSSVVISNLAGSTEYYISNCSSLPLGKKIVTVTVEVTRVENSAKYSILKNVSLNITNKDFYYFDFITKSLNTVIDSSTITLKVYYNIYKYSAGTSVKQEGGTNQLWICHSESLDLELDLNWENPKWDDRRLLYVINDMPVEYSISDYSFALATKSSGNLYIILDTAELPVLYYGKSDRRMYYLMTLLKGYELPNIFITYELSFNIINAIHTYFKNNLSYDDFINKNFTFVLNRNANNYTVREIKQQSEYDSTLPLSSNIYVCLVLISSTASGVTPYHPYEFYAVSLMNGARYEQFGEIMINSSIGLDGYGRRYIYLKTNKLYDEVRDCYLGIDRNINNDALFLNDEFCPTPILDSDDIWSDNILEPDVYQQYVYEFSDKKERNIWKPFESYILRNYFKNVFLFNNDNNNIIVDDDASDNDVYEIAKTRFSFFDGELNHKLYITNRDDTFNYNNIYVSTSSEGPNEYVITISGSYYAITDLSYANDGEFISYNLKRNTDTLKFNISNFQLTYSIYKYENAENPYGNLIAISNQNVVVKDFNSGEIYKIITNPTLIGVRAVDNTERSYVLEDLYKSGGIYSNLKLYFLAYSKGNMRSLIQDNKLESDFYFTLNGIQTGRNLFDHCVYDGNLEYGTKHIKDIIFTTDQYNFLSDATNHDNADICGYCIIDGLKKSIKYYKNSGGLFLYCKDDDSEDETYYFYVLRYNNTEWNRAIPSSAFQRNVTYIPVVIVNSGFISDGIVFEPTQSGDHFEIKIENIFIDNALPTLIDLYYQGGDFSQNPIIVDSQTISYVKAGLPGNDILPIVKFTVEPEDAIFLVDEDGKYSNLDLLLSYHIIAEYGIDKKPITAYDMSSVTINGSPIPNSGSTNVYYTYVLYGDEFTVTIHNYNTLQSSLLKKKIRINCSFTCEYGELEETYSRVVSMFATPISSSSPNITYKFVPNATSVNLVWSYGSSYYFPSRISGQLFILIGDKQIELTLDGAGSITGSSTGTYKWELIDRNEQVTERKTTEITLQPTDDYYTIRFCYTINGVSYTYDIPINKGQLQEYFISIKGTAIGDTNNIVSPTKSSVLEGTRVIDSIQASGDSAGILLTIYDTLNKLQRQTTENEFYIIDNQNGLETLNSVLNSINDSRYIVCLASYKYIKLTQNLYNTLLKFGLGDLKYVQIGGNSAKTPFAFIGYYGLAKGKACYQESQSLPTESSVEISAKIVDGTLDFSKTGENVQYIYLKGDARNGDNSGEFGNSCEVRINNGQNVALIARGTNLVTINRKELNVVESINYDTYSEAHPSGTGTGITDLKEKLDELNNDVFVCLVSSDAIGWDEDLIDQLYDYGMELLPYTEVGRYPFLFIGYKGLGKGNGFTRMNNIATPAIPVELSVYIANGAFTSKDGQQGSNGYPGCVTRMFKTNVVDGKTYYNQTKSNPNVLPDGVCKLDYMVVFDGENYYAFVAKRTHTVTKQNDPFLNSLKQINNYSFDKNNVYDSSGQKIDASLLVAADLWDPVDMDGSAFFTSFTAVSGYIETLSGSAILLTENTNGSSYINAGFRTSLDLNDDDIVLWSGSKLPKEIEDGKIKTNAVKASANNATFRVTKDGTLYAKQGVFEGNVLSIPKVDGLWITSKDKEFMTPTLTSIPESGSGNSIKYNIVPFIDDIIELEPNCEFYPDSNTTVGLWSNWKIGDMSYVPHGSDVRFKYVFDINSGMSCIANKLCYKMLIDLPSYIDIFNVLLDSETIWTVVDNCEYITRLYNSNSNITVTLDTNDFYINPCLLHKYIGLYYVNNIIEKPDEQHDNYIVIEADLYNITNNVFIGHFKADCTKDIDGESIEYVIQKIWSDENSLETLKNIKEIELGYKLWVESFIGKEFTLVIPYDKITHTDHLFYSNDIYIRGCSGNTLPSPYKSGNLVNLHKLLNYAFNLKYIFKSKISGSDDYASIANANEKYAYIKWSKGETRQTMNVHSGSSSSDAFIHPSVVMKFICRKELNTYTNSHSQISTYNSVFWDLQSYEVIDGNLSNITVENKVQYF